MSVKFGNEIRVEQLGKEVHLIFVATTAQQADALRGEIIAQIKEGGFHLTLMGQAVAEH